MSQRLDIPAPLPEDSESVVTALETAAVFAEKGDAAEAVRWLKRATESSGETGDDTRTLALARVAADWTAQVREAAAKANASAVANGAPTALETPRPPSATETPRPASVVLAAPVGGQSATETPRAAPASEGPQRWLPKPPPRVPSSLIPIGGVEKSSTRPPPPSARPHSTPIPSRPMSSHAPLSGRSVPSNGKPSVAAPLTSRAESAPRPPPLPDTSATNGVSSSRDTLASPISAISLGTAPSPTPSTTPSFLAQKRASSVTPARAEVTAEAPRLRQAARVSVVPSSTERGLFLVRLLEDGHAAPEDGTEGFLVLVDPNAALFNR